MLLIPNKIRLSVNVTMIEAWEANIAGAGAGTEIKSIPLPLSPAGSCSTYFKLKSCFLFTILQFVNNRRNLLKRCLDTVSRTETDNRAELSDLQ